MIKTMILAAAALTMSGTMANAQTMIEKNNIKVENHLMTPEALWAMGRWWCRGFAQRQANRVPSRLLQRQGEQGSPDALHHGRQWKEPEGPHH